MCGAALVVDLLHGEVGHEAVRGGAVPVILAVHVVQARPHGGEQTNLGDG